jgi:hypothetical protein
MLADQLDYVVGVDPHGDSHALAVVHVVSGTVVFEATVVASSDGYAQALKLVDQHAPGRRAFAVEGTGSFGAGLTRFLTAQGERVLEVGRLRRERRSGVKTDALDAVRAARSVLTSKRPATPRAGGDRQALQALVGRTRGRGQRQACRTLPAPRPADHDAGAAAQPAAAADACTAAATPRSNTTRRRARSRTARQQARAALGSATRTATDRGGTRARTRNRGTHSQARTAATRTARRRTARRCTTRALLVTPRADRLRGSLRTARRRSADPGLLRPDDPLPARPKRRPKAQPRTAHDPRHPQTLTPRHDRLHQPTHPRRQDTTRSQPLPQALPRPQPLPTPRARANDHLTFIEASPRRSSPARSRAAQLDHSAGAGEPEVGLHAHPG